MNTILQMQPGVSDGGGGKASDELVGEVSSSILEKLEGFDLKVEIVNSRKSTHVVRSSRITTVKSLARRKSGLKKRSVCL